MFDHFDLLAPIYDRLISPPDPNRLQELLQLPIAGSMLDAGGGTGRVSHQLRSLVDELVLIDLSAGMLQQARSKGELAISMAQTERLPFPCGSFERVLVVDALHHFHDQRQAVADLLRVLRPGGRLVIEEPDLNHLGVKVIALLEKLAFMRSRFFYPAEIGEMVADCGLSAEIRDNGDTVAWVVVDK